MKKHILTTLLTILSVCQWLHGTTYNLRQITSRDGLSNSAVYCLFQDDERFLWIGTFDGLNMYDGRNIRIYKPDINNRHSLSSNVIRNIVETGNDYLWISTKWGLNKLSQKTNTVEEYYHDFKEDAWVAKDNRDNLYVLGYPGTLSVYNKAKKSFDKLPVNKDIVCRNVTSLLVDANDTIWINHKGTLERYTVSFGEDSLPLITRHADYPHPSSVAFITKSRERLLFVDSLGGLYSINPRRTVFIRDLSEVVKENGDISSIIYDYPDILVAFRTNGLVKLHSQEGYREEKVDINCGVFSLLKDEEQDVIWIGTDGQGIYAWTRDDYTFRNLLLSELPVKKQRPVRAICIGRENDMWLGTKDNGIIRIHSYNSINEYNRNNITHYTTNNGLVNNNVFAFMQSRYHPVMWIGSDGPDLNYYAYADDKIYNLSVDQGFRVAFVHAIIESSDSLLWAGSGSTLARIHIAKKGKRLVSEQIKRYTFELKNNQPYNQIYSLHQENDTCIWIGMRGNGIIQFNPVTEKHRLVAFDENGIAPMNDVLSIYQNKDKTLWLGTSYGLIRLRMHPDGNYQYKNYNENNGLSNNTIHGILEAPDGKLWLSSNTGIILFDPATENFRNFNHKTGLKVIEFSDNAYYTDTLATISFFGGVDGLVWITQEEIERKRFIPEIYFTGLRIYNQEYNIHDFKKEKDNKPYVELKHNQNFFAFTFVAMDFVNGANSSYSYRLRNFNDVWMDTRSNEAQFTNIPPGEYLLQVKYNDGTGNLVELMESIRIVVLPPWYQTIYAFALYVLLLVGCMGLVFYLIVKKYEKRKKEMNRSLNEKYKEEMYEGKLRFFTNITHEFSTPLTLIYGPCERILSDAQSSDRVKKYAGIIKSNAERLNALIQEIIDFRRMETGNKVCRFVSTDISRLATEVVGSFNDLAEQNNIAFRPDISLNIHWNTDSNAFSKILTNLISNAFKYTPEKGEIIVSIGSTTHELILKVYNTGKGIEKENIPLIFNRYSVLDNVKENNIKGLSSRNGLGLAICHSMTELLGGSIRVESEVNKYACFIITLPVMEAQQDSVVETSAQESSFTPDDSGLNETDTFIAVDTEAGKSSILLIDDNPEMRWMLNDILSPEYNILAAEDGEKGLEMIRNKTPDLIITDIMMPNMDGITLTRRIKEDRYLMHIPLVILSAKVANEEKIEGIESGADIYIPKPFDPMYLRTVVRNLIRNKKNLEVYYNSSASAFDYSNGQLMKVEDRDFLETVIRIIDDNLDNPEFSPDELAAGMQMSVRNLYRKFKELAQSPPNDFIKEQRINHAARLIRTTTLTIQEVMYHTGFNNRSHFYREFSKRYGVTPREYRMSNE